MRRQKEKKTNKSLPEEGTELNFQRGPGLGSQTHKPLPAEVPRNGAPTASHRPLLLLPKEYSLKKKKKDDRIDIGSVLDLEQKGRLERIGRKAPLSLLPFFLNMPLVILLGLFICIINTEHRKKQTATRSVSSTSIWSNRKTQFELYYMEKGIDWFMSLQSPGWILQAALSPRPGVYHQGRETLPVSQPCSPPR